jgi:hypothetical protein
MPREKYIKVLQGGCECIRSKDLGFPISGFDPGRMDIQQAVQASLEPKHQLLVRREVVGLGKIRLAPEPAKVVQPTMNVVRLADFQEPIGKQEKVEMGELHLGHVGHLKHA